MSRIHNVSECDESELALLLTPRNDALVLEAADSPSDSPSLPGATGQLAFSLEHGPFSSYERTVGWSSATPPAGAEPSYRVEEVIEFRLAIPYWSWLYRIPVARSLRTRLEPGRAPWWSTPDRLSSRESTIVAAVVLLNTVGGLLYGLLTQVLTFVAADLGDGSRSEQTSLLAFVRVGVLVTMVVMVLADRLGRRKVAIAAFMGSAALTLLTALAPSLWAVGSLQFVARNLAIAGLLCADTIAVEEMPPGSRAMVASLGTLAYGLGAGMIVMTLPLADVGSWGWRLTFVAAGCSLPVIWHASRHLPESKRFTRIATDIRSRTTPDVRTTAPAKVRPRTRTPGFSFFGSGLKISPRRLVIVGGIFFLLNIFLAPASQLQNDYLRSDVGFSGTMITIFVLLTSTPGGLGVLIGGRVADVHGRRWAIIPGLSAIAIFYTWFFSTTNTGMWAASLLASVLGGMAAPALAVIAPELFPTARRGTIRGVVTGLAVAGSVLGLVLSGYLIDARGYSSAFILLAVAPVAAALLALALPETRGRELEEINR